MEKLLVSYSTISRVFINKTINCITKISFHKHFKIKFLVCFQINARVFKRLFYKELSSIDRNDNLTCVVIYGNFTTCVVIYGNVTIIADSILCVNKLYFCRNTA